jgi:putative hydrolase of the HAD superfamily
MSARARLLLFDLDGVLADYDRTARCAALARAAGAPPEAVYEALFGVDGVEHASDRGELGLRDALERLRERHGWTIAAAEFVQARRLATRVRPDMLTLCAALAPQARLAMFTNNGDWVAAHLAAIAPELPALFGEAVVSSGQMGQCKPEASAFRTCLARLGDVHAADALFIDDNADNAAGALAAGLDAIHFTTLRSLRRALRERGFALTGDDDAP